VFFFNSAGALVLKEHHLGVFADIGEEFADALVWNVFIKRMGMIMRPFGNLIWPHPDIIG